jgi:hypothetical protein
MARPLRFQYAGASYHLMARGDGGKAVFEEDNHGGQSLNPEFLLGRTAAPR